MNATQFVFSSTAPSVIGPAHQVTLETTCEHIDHRGVRPDSTGVQRMSGRRFPPYIQDPPFVLDRTVRPTSI